MNLEALIQRIIQDRRIISFLLMSRHSKNATSAAFFSYHERKKLDAGKKKEILGQGAFRKFECCWLCLRPALSPVCTPDGLIFCKSCLYLNFDAQKKKQRQQQTLYDQQQKLSIKEDQEKEERKKRKQQDEFFENDSSAHSYAHKFIKVDNYESPKKATVISVTKEEARKNNFWIVQNTPTASKRQIQPPPKHLECPITEKPLRMKQLITVNPSIVDTDNKGDVKWMCAVSGDPLIHQKAVLIKPTGQIVLESLLEKFVFGKSGFVEDREIQRSDVIALVPGGSGFSAHNNLEASIDRPCIQ